MPRFVVVCIRRVRTDYLVEAADERDAWNRVGHFGRDAGVREVRAPVEIQYERFVVPAPERGQGEEK